MTQLLGTFSGIARACDLEIAAGIVLPNPGIALRMPIRSFEQKQTSAFCDLNSDFARDCKLVH